jgi:N-glycosylase/DNA lyase
MLGRERSRRNAPKGETLQVPVPFDLDLTVRSHGWWDLQPWRYDEDRRVLSRPLRLEGGRTVLAEVAEAVGTGEGLALRLTADGRLPPGAGSEARRAMGACLGIDEDLVPFYRLIEELERDGAGRRDPLPDLSWARLRGAGRLLRSPTVFEDAVKTLCTTNCSWSLTRTMVSRLVAELGDPAPGGTRCFPTPEAMAARPERFYRQAIHAGYRAPYLRRLAQQVAAGHLDPEAWRGSPLSTDDLGKEIRSVAGFGPYASEHLLRLLGRHDHLALDSWNRKKLARLRAMRRPPSDRSARRWYRPYGKWAGLAMWLEVTADWHSGKPTWPPREEVT